MANGSKITNDGLKIMLNRSWKSSPDFTVPSEFKVGTGTNTPTVTDTDLQTAVNIDGDNFKGFVTGYPVLDEVNIQVTIRTILSTTDANGNVLTEVGLVNTDGSRLLYSRTVHNAITKNNQTQVIYVQKDRFG